MRTRRDAAALLAVVAAAAAVVGWLLRGGTLLATDAVTQFVPWYGYLGEQLRAGQVPGWNPHVLSGAPFAGDPLSGWWYLPAMVLFTVLPLGAATSAYLLVTPVLAGAGAYLLARRLGLTVGGALVAGIAYELSGFVVVHDPCCFAYAAVAAWLPWLLLGVAVAVEAPSWRGRLRGWALSGLALSQLLAGWFGQGFLYAAVLLGAWVAWRTVAVPPAGARAWRARVGGLALHGGAVLLAGAGLAAAGLLPRLEFNAVSSLAGGYPGGARTAAVGGWDVADWRLLLTPGRWYAGAATLALAVAAPVLARGRHHTVFLAGVCAAALVLTSQLRTPLHLALFLVPTAGRLHPHSPERIVMVFYLCAALLAGAAVTALARRATRPGRLPPWLPAALAVAVVGADLVAADTAAVTALRTSRLRGDRLVAVDVDTLGDAGPAVAFLRRAGSGAGGGRYVGYDRAPGTAYTVRWADPGVTALGVNNSAILAGVATTQGYNPTHLARYDELLVALNGGPQDYHFADVGLAGLDSPLLDLLNVRWLLVPEVAGGDPAGVARLTRRLPTVFTGGGVRVLENPEVLPRAWLVHDARRVERGEALELLATGAVDPRRTALLEAEPPPLAAPVDATRDRATVVDYAADAVTVRTASGADALLVVSELAYPAWRATVDGRPTEVLVADHALRAVAVPAGDHTVALRFVSPALTAGLAVSTATAIVLLAGALAPRRRRRCRETVTAPDAGHD